MDEQIGETFEDFRRIRVKGIEGQINVVCRAHPYAVVEVAGPLSLAYPVSVRLTRFGTIVVKGQRVTRGSSFARLAIGHGTIDERNRTKAINGSIIVCRTGPPLKARDWPLAITIYAPHGTPFMARKIAGNIHVI